MSIEFKESVEAEAIGSDNDKPARVGPRARDHRADGDRRPAVASVMLAPKLIADAGENTSDFLTANIRNPNTRAAYAVAVRAARGGEEEMWRRAPPPYRNYSLTIWAPRRNIALTMNVV